MQNLKWAFGGFPNNSLKKYVALLFLSPAFEECRVYCFPQVGLPVSMQVFYNFHNLNISTPIAFKLGTQMHISMCWWSLLLGSVVYQGHRQTILNVVAIRSISVTHKYIFNFNFLSTELWKPTAYLANQRPCGSRHRLHAIQDSVRSKVDAVWKGTPR